MVSCVDDAHCNASCSARAQVLAMSAPPGQDVFVWALATRSGHPEHAVLRLAVGSDTVPNKPDVCAARIVGMPAAAPAQGAAGAARAQSRVVLPD